MQDIPPVGGWESYCISQRFRKDFGFFSHELFLPIYVSVSAVFNLQRAELAENVELMAGFMLFHVDPLVKI